MSKKVLILSEAVGNGHTRAAEALQQGIAHLNPSVETQIIEVGQTLNPFSSKLFINFYINLIILFPNVWRKIYRHKQEKPLSQWKKVVIYLLFHRRIEQLIIKEKPDMIICTHPFTSATLSSLKNKGYPFTLCTLITDFHVHGAWVHKYIDYYLVSSDDVVEQLLEMDIPRSQLVVTGIPTNSSFWDKKDKVEVREKLQLKHIPSVMVMGGGLGLGGMKELSEQLTKWKDNIQVIICTGRNEKLRKVLLSQEKYQHPNIRILGFRNDIDEWMEAADLLITKAGGVTCFEALSKGLPMYIYKPIPGHEESNCDILVKNCLAEKLDESYTINELIEKLLYAPAELEMLQMKLKAYQGKIDPLASAELVIDLLYRKKNPTYKKPISYTLSNEY